MKWLKFFLNNTREQVGTVDFVFSEMTGGGGSYIYIGVNMRGGTSLVLNRCLALDGQGRGVANITSRSAGGANQVGEVYAIGQRYPTGLIVGSVAKSNDGLREVVIGDITGVSVRDKDQKVVGELVMYWSPDDESLLLSALEAFAQQTRSALDLDRDLEYIRGRVHKAMMEIAGGAALVMKLFDPPKKRGLFR